MTGSPVEYNYEIKFSAINPAGKLTVLSLTVTATNMSEAIRRAEAHLAPGQRPTSIRNMGKAKPFVTIRAGTLRRGR